MSKDKQIEAISLEQAAKLALEALERLDGWIAFRHGLGLTPQEKEVVTALREALAKQQAQQSAERGEPVAVVSGYYGGQCVIVPTNPARIFNSGTAFYTTPQAQPRGEATLAREPLTDEEIREASLQAGMQEHYMDFHSGFIRFARAIEAAHGITGSKT